MPWETESDYVKNAVANMGDALCAVRNVAFGPENRQAGGDRAAQEAERVEGLCCLLAHSITGYIHGPANHRNLELRSIQDIITAEFNRGGAAAVARLATALDGYTTTGGGGGMIHVTRCAPMVNNDGRTTGWTLTVRNRDNPNAAAVEVRVPRN